MGRRFERFIIIVLDSVGVGELPDAADYGDSGSNTLANTARAVGGLQLPTLQGLGLGNIGQVEGVPPASTPEAAYGKMAEVSAGKDTTTGHWEMMGVVLDKPFPTYPDGFPEDVISRFEAAVGRRVLGNKPASGTEIIEELGERHMETGSPIVYTSADSVFQIAAHEGVIPLDQLYRMCLTARQQLTGESGVGRVIARPFAGEPGAFVRTPNRRDFSIEPPAPTVLDRLSDSGLAVAGVGKIGEIFAGRGLTSSNHTPDNMSSVDETIRLLSEGAPGLIFTNLVDFDMLWGHRNDPTGYAKGLAAVDDRLPELIDALRPDDVLVLTADHGCDPTTESTDHSREYVPLIVYGSAVLPGVDLGTRRTFADLGATVAENFGLEPLSAGESFLEDLRVR